MFHNRKNKLYEEYTKAQSDNSTAYKALKMEQEIYKQTNKQFLKTEGDMKALQTVGHIVGEVLEKLDNERFIVKSSQGPRYVVGCMKYIDRKCISAGTRVALDITTLTIVVVLQKEVDPVIYSMSEENPENISFECVGGLRDQIRELKEVIELPLKNPEIFKRIGIKPPKGVLMYGPPGTGKTSLARIVAATTDVNFMKVVSSALIEKYIGESSRMIRDMFAYARRKAPCIVFMDEIDAIGGKRTTDSSSSDREVQRTLMELLNQLDGFKELDNVKVIMATNRPDILDQALLRPGRLDRKIEIPLPNEQGRREILRIHSKNMNSIEEIDYDSLVSLTASFNGADLRAVCTEAGMIALKDERDYVRNEDFVKSARKIFDAKKLETKLDYKKN